jgi:hypothetical protein
MKKAKNSTSAQSPSELIDGRIKELGDWRGRTLSKVRGVIKLTFAKGAHLKDPKRLFNSSLECNLRRAIDLHEGEKINEAAFKALIAKRSR